jgi:hypothetical protein
MLLRLFVDYLSDVIDDYNDISRTFFHYSPLTIILTKLQKQKKHTDQHKKKHKHITKQKATKIQKVSDSENLLKKEKKKTPKTPKTPKQDKDTLSTSTKDKIQILQKINDAIQKSIQTQNSQNIQANIDEYFENVNGVLIPKTIQFYINGQTVDIPKFTMVGHSNIELKKLRFKFKTNAVEMGFSDTDTTPFQTEIVFDTCPNPPSGYLKLTELFT